MKSSAEAPTSSDVSYTCSLPQPTFRLGEQVEVVLRLSAATATGVTPGFDHPSLMLVLSSRSNPEDLTFFPNRRAAATQQRLSRYVLPTSSLRLDRNGMAERHFDLLALFPERLYASGQYTFSYSFDGLTPSIRSAAVDFEVHSGPDSVERLFQAIKLKDSSATEEAAETLERMLGSDFGFSQQSSDTRKLASLARWRKWWKTTGSHLPWNYGSGGATHGVLPETQSAQTALRLGGVAYP